MNLLHLQYFYVVAKEGGFTNAAKALRIQQPAISRMVSQLEEAVGFALFERVGRKVQLTSQGREVFEHARRVFDDVEQLKLAIGQLKGEPRGPLIFGASEPIASHFVPKALAKLLPSYPEIYPNVYSGPASVIFDRIKSGELEFGLFFHTPDLPKGLKLQKLKKVRFHLVVMNDLKRKRPVLESFIGSREIDDNSTRVFPTLARLKRIHPGASIRISSNSLTAHRLMVLNGLGVAVLPDFLIGRDLELGAVVDVLPQERLEFDLKLVTRALSTNSMNAEAFLRCCSEI